MRICVVSFGCSSNIADGQVLTGCLSEAGHEIVHSITEAEIVVINTCAVKGPTENRMIETLKHIPQNKKLVITGCLPLINIERIKSETRFDGVVGPAAGQKILEIVNQVSRGGKVVSLESAEKELPRLSLPRMQASSIIRIIPISYGCLGSCAYCCVTHARGSVRSYNINEIVERVEADARAGFREFWLTSQDVACYGKDKGTNLAELLLVLGSLDGDFKIRIGMMTPNAASSILPGLIDAFEDKHVFKFVHLPVQSGDDEVLKRMRRFYSVEDFKRIVSAFRTSFADMTLSTDVICGFPGETSEAFERTMRLIEEVKPDVVNVSKFFARPRTLAAEMQSDFVQISEIRRRSEIAASHGRDVAFDKNLRWVGWNGEVLIDEIGRVPGSWVGRNFAYKPTVVKSMSSLLGKTVCVKVVEAFPTYLMAEIVD